MLENQPVFIAIDGGGTKTTCAICDQMGRVLASSSGDSANILSRPWIEVEHTLHLLVEHLLHQAGCNRTDVSSLFFGLAGADRPLVSAKIEDSFRPLYEGRVSIDNDAITALYSGTFGKPGIVLLAGTGSIAYSVDSNGERHRVGGWGYLLGDEGSGFDLGRKALTAVLREYDGRGTPTLLTQVILEYCQLNDPSNVIAHIYESPNPRKRIGEIARLVMDTAEQGDILSIEILDQAVDSLIELIEACERKTGNAGSVVLAGGLFAAGTWMSRKLQKLLGMHRVVIVPKVPPVVGSLVMALMREGIVIDEERKQNLIESWLTRK